MKYIPILFSTPMVQAILAGSKTMTRRIVKLQPGEGEYYEKLERNEYAYISHGGMSGPYLCPYGTEGDVLWVRETTIILEPEHCIGGMSSRFVYKADMNNFSEQLRQDHIIDGYPYKWIPSIFMKKEACRLFLKVKFIRIEQLQNITEQDAKSEGVEKDKAGWYKNYLGPDHWGREFKCHFASESFREFWIKINGAESWNNNPWVWVIEFERTEKPESFNPQAPASASPELDNTAETIRKKEQMGRINTGG